MGIIPLSWINSRLGLDILGRLLKVGVPTLRLQLGNRKTLLWKSMIYLILSLSLIFFLLKRTQDLISF
jgi:hypothetical protein